jgi:coenzyme PQQ synthesis protein D (PqqD)
MLSRSQIELPLDTLPAKTHSAQTLRVNADVLWQRLDDEVIVIQLKTDHIYSLNHTGARLWELLADGKDLPSIRIELENEFSVSPDKLATEIEDTLSLLVSEQLLITLEP